MASSTTYLTWLFFFSKEQRKKSEFVPLPSSEKKLERKKRNLLVPSRVRVPAELHPLSPDQPVHRREHDVEPVDAVGERVLGLLLLPGRGRGLEAHGALRRCRSCGGSSSGSITYCSGRAAACTPSWSHATDALIVASSPPPVAEMRTRGRLGSGRRRSARAAAAAATVSLFWGAVAAAAAAGADERTSAEERGVCFPEDRAAPPAVATAPPVPPIGVAWPIPAGESRSSSSRSVSAKWRAPETETDSDEGEGAAAAVAALAAAAAARALAAASFLRLRCQTRQERCSRRASRSVPPRVEVAYGDGDGENEREREKEERR